MKNAATIFILVLLVSIQTPVGQVFKLPLLIEHYLKHQEQDLVSVFDFLEDHYASDHTDADLPEDEQLPFKKITFYSFGYAVVAPFIQTSEPAPSNPVRKAVIPYTYNPQQHLVNIFHPPRI